jgi:hypothetical protein
MNSELITYTLIIILIIVLIYYGYIDFKESILLIIILLSDKIMDQGANTTGVLKREKRVIMPS